MLSTYTDVGVQGAAANGDAGHALIGMLFDGALGAIARARGALQAGDIAAKSRAIAQALGIVGEGLHASLDIAAGGALAADLDQLYIYIELRLTHANLRNDDAALEECMNLLRPLQDGWTRIASQVRQPA
jgi:flagellar protein FliS